MQLQDLTDPELIFPHLEGTDRNSVLRSLARKMAERGRVTDAEELYTRLAEREELGSTGVGSGVAIPHCKMEGLERVLMAIGILDQAIDFGALDGAPVRLFFLIVSPQRSPAAHLQCLAAISSWVKVEGHVEDLQELDDPIVIYSALADPPPDGGD